MKFLVWWNLSRSKNLQNIFPLLRSCRPPTTNHHSINKIKHKTLIKSRLTTSTEGKTKVREIQFNFYFDENRKISGFHEGKTFHLFDLCFAAINYLLCLWTLTAIVTYNFPRTRTIRAENSGEFKDEKLSLCFVERSIKLW